MSRRKRIEPTFGKPVRSYLLSDLFPEGGKTFRDAGVPTVISAASESEAIRKVIRMAPDAFKMKHAD